MCQRSRSSDLRRQNSGQVRGWRPFQGPPQPALYRQRLTRRYSRRWPSVPGPFGEWRHTSRRALRRSQARPAFRESRIEVDQKRPGGSEVSSSVLPSAIEFIQVLRGDNQRLCKGILGRIPHMALTLVAKPPITNPVMRFGVRIHVHCWLLVGVGPNRSLDDHFIDLPSPLPPKPSPKSSPNSSNPSTPSRGKSSPANKSSNCSACIK